MISSSPDSMIQRSEGMSISPLPWSSRSAPRMSGCSM